MSPKRYNHTWKAIQQAGETDPYFSFPFPKFNCNSKQFDPINALWLAEISRLTYKYGRLIRKEILEANGFFDIMEMNTGRSCGLLCSGYDQNDTLFHIIAFKGTDSIHDWIGNFKMIPAKWKNGGTVHSGFIDAYTLIEKYVLLGTENRSNIYITGHSLGGALSLLATTELKQNVSAVYTFGAPKVGDTSFNDLLYGIPIYRISNIDDFVPKVPVLVNLKQAQHSGDPIILDANGQIIVSEFSSKKTTGLRGIFTNLNKRTLFGPPKFISDHAPINYVYRIYNYLNHNKML